MGTMIVPPGKGGGMILFPTLQQWKDMTDLGTPLTRARQADLRLLRIDTLVAAYNKERGSNGSAGKKAYILGELFFATVHWLNNFLKDPAHMDPGHKPAIISLSFTVTKQLALVLGCLREQVPARLLSIFGKAMELHGMERDTKDVSHYLSVAQREQWRVVFQGGKAYGFKDNTGALGSLGLLDTTEYGKVMAIVEGGLTGEADRNGDAGFALSISNDLYVGPLIGAKKPRDRLGLVLTQKGISTSLDNAPVFHSSFMGGAPVLCAGMISVKNGIVTLITTGSGHYVPGYAFVVKVLQLLQSVGMDIKKIEVQLFDEGGGSIWTDAKTCLEKHGNWEAIRKESAQRVWDEYQRSPGAHGLYSLVRDRFNYLKLSVGKNMTDAEVWKMAYEQICWSLAVFDPAWEEIAKQPPISRAPPRPVVPHRLPGSNQ